MPSRFRRLSPQALSVLLALSGSPKEWRYGLEIAVATNLKSGSLYPILVRLHERGLLESKWLEPERAGRPARHAYRLTRAGGAVLREATQAVPSTVKQGAF